MESRALAPGETDVEGTYIHVNNAHMVETIETRATVEKSLSSLLIFVHTFERSFLKTYYNNRCNY